MDLFEQRTGRRLDGMVSVAGTAAADTRIEVRMADAGVDG